MAAEPRAMTRDEIREAAGRVAAGLGVPARFDEPLAPHTTMGVGGPVPAFLLPRTPAELAALVAGLRAAGVPLRTLGAGSNLIVDDAGVSCAVVSTADLPQTIERVPSRDGGDSGATGSTGTGRLVRAGAGILLPRLVRALAGDGIGGFEFLEGIPGTLGGALAMNAGAGGRWIGDVVESVEAVTPEGALETSRPAPEDFGYRRSFVSRRGLVATGAVLRGVADDPERIRERIRDSRTYRVATQPLSERSSGCIFKNPAGDSAGALLDRLNLKGTRSGGAFLSERHANFIVNRGGTSGDIGRLIGELRERVRSAGGPELELEVIVWSDGDGDRERVVDGGGTR